MDKKKLIKETFDLLAILDMPPHPVIDNDSKFRFFSRGGYSIGLRDRAVDKFEVALKVISDFPDYKNISIKRLEDEYIQSLINILLQNSGYTEETIRTEIERCLNGLIESIEERRVLIPMESLKLEGLSELRIGNVRFIEYDTIHETMKSKLYEIVDHNSTIQLEQKEFHKTHLEEFSIEPFINKVCADVTVNSEAEKSYSKARCEVDDAVNLLRCYIPLLFSRGSKVQIGIYGDNNNCSGFRSFLSIKQNGGFNCRSERFGPLEPYIMSPDKLMHLKEDCYLDLLGSILAKDVKSRMDLEKRIINSIRWIGTGIHSGTDCDKFLMFIIAIESLLIKHDEEGKASPIAERCAFLLSDMPEKRIQNDEKMKALYNTRSRIVHEGLTEITAEEAGSAQWLAISCLFAVCKRLNNWHSLDQIIKWVKEQRYGMDNKTVNSVSSIS